jgi:hypothetical protein
MHSSPTSCHFLLGPNILLSILFSNTLNLHFPLVWETKFHTHTYTWNRSFDTHFKEHLYASIKPTYLQRNNKIRHVIATPAFREPMQMKCSV